MLSRVKNNTLIWASLITISGIISVIYHINNQKLKLEMYEYKSKLTINHGEYIHQIEEIYHKLLKFRSFIPKEKRQDFHEMLIYLSTLAPVSAHQSYGDTNITTLFSCSEAYTPATYEGWPWTKGWTRQKCQRPPIRDSTALFLALPLTGDSNLLKMMIDNATKLFHHVVVLVYENYVEIVKRLVDKKELNKFDVVAIGGTSGFTYGDALNYAVSLLKCQFILIASHLGRMDDDLNLERLINTQELTSAALVGGAVKDIKTGKWEHGCYQTQLKLNTLKYTKGYRTSRQECLYCESIASPFLGRKDMFLKFKFSKFDHGLFEDLFLRLKRNGEKIISCPDIMFYIEKKEENEKELSDFANEWEIRRIIGLLNKELWFGFKEGSAVRRKTNFNVLDKKQLSYSCSASPSLVISPDCRHNLLDALHFMFDLLTKHNITCEVEEGTLMGIVKFNNVLPWERDADITFLSHQFPLIKRLKDFISKRGFRLNVVEEAKLVNGVYRDGVFYVYANGWTIEMYGKSELMERHKPYTLLQLGKHLVPAPENPGLYVRNRYGVEIYRHVEHWRTLNQEHGFVSYQSGQFPKCTKPLHQTCLDQFHADGNLQFLEFL